MNPQQKSDDEREEISANLYLWKRLTDMPGSYVFEYYDHWYLAASDHVIVEKLDSALVKTMVDRGILLHASIPMPRGMYQGILLDAYIPDATWLEHNPVRTDA